MSSAEPGCDRRLWLRETYLGSSPEGSAARRRRRWHGSLRTGRRGWLPRRPRESPGVKVEAEPAAPYPVIGGWGEVEPVPVYAPPVRAGKPDAKVLAVTCFRSLFLRLHAGLLVKRRARVIRDWPAVRSAAAVPGGEPAARANAVPGPSAMLEGLQPDGVL